MAKKKESLPPSPGGVRKKTFFWVFLIFFISAWMFVLGILVGRGTAPVHFDIEKLQKELAALKEAGLRKEIKRYKIDQPAAAEKTDLGFHEALKTPAEGAGKKKQTSDRRIADRRDPAEKVSAPAGTPAPTPATKPDGQGQKARMPAPDNTGKGLTIQVASSRDIGFADSLVARLKAENYPAYRVTARIPGKGTWHRVRIGSFRNRAEAARFLERLKKDRLEGIIVKESL